VSWKLHIHLIHYIYKFIKLVTIQFLNNNKLREVKQMIISDLQHIESASEIEVNGGCGYCPPDPCKPKPMCYKPSYNVAGADASAQAFGTNTKAYTNTDTLVIEGQFSGSRSSSFAEAS
jgi:hypothetical protein